MELLLRSPDETAFQMGRRPVVIAAAVEKLGLCVIVVMGWNEPALQAFRPTLFIDGAIVLIFGLYLLSGASSSQGR